MRDDKELYRQSTACRCDETKSHVEILLGDCAMGIEYRVLGLPGRDNALFVRINSGQRITRLLFDCGEAVLETLSFAEVQAIDHLCFSHLHMDHISGFDSFFRAVYARTDRPNRIWGPPETARILHHRFCGFLWNLYEDDHASWFVHDILPERIESTRFEASEAFAVAHEAGVQPFNGVVLDTPDFSVSALHMDHLTPSMAYIVREKPHLNVDTSRLAALGLRGGPWLKQLKDAAPEVGIEPAEQATIEIEGQQYPLAELRAALLVETPGDALAYLTDFLLDEAAMERLIPALRGCDTLVCECQYRDDDVALARKNHHMTASQVATLAQRAGVERLVLFHLSDRYRHDGWQILLDEARRIFPNTRFPAGWDAITGDS
jgi:ribonuclease Z